MDVSIIIPLLNESDSLKELNSCISKSFGNLDLESELIYIDDGSCILYTSDAADE